MRCGEGLSCSYAAHNAVALQIQAGGDAEKGDTSGQHVAVLIGLKGAAGSWVRLAARRRW